MLISEKQDIRIRGNLGTFGHFIKIINDGNDQDAEWSLSYCAPGFSFTTKDNKLMELAYNYCTSMDMLIDVDTKLEDFLTKEEAA